MEKKGLKIGVVLSDGFIDIEIGKKGFGDSGLKIGVVLSDGFIDIEVGKKGFGEMVLKERWSLIRGSFIPTSAQVQQFSTGNGGKSGMIFGI